MRAEKVSETSSKQRSHTRAHTRPLKIGIPLARCATTCRHQRSTAVRPPNHLLHAPTALQSLMHASNIISNCRVKNVKQVASKLKTTSLCAYSFAGPAHPWHPSRHYGLPYPVHTVPLTHLYTSLYYC